MAETTNTNIQFNEFIDPSQDTPTGRDVLNTDDIGQKLLGVNTPLSRAKILHILNENGVPAEETKIDVVHSNPSYPEQEFTFQETVIDGMPEDASEIVASYLAKHQEEVIEVYSLANELLPDLKRRVINSLSNYGLKLGIESVDLRALFERRLQSITEVKAEDWLLDSDSPFNFSSGVGANFSMRNGKNKVKVIPDEIGKAATLRRIDLRTAIELSLMHELEHAASFIGTFTGRDAPRSGLRVNDVNEHGQMLVRSHGALFLDEGAQEDILWKSGLERSRDVTYIHQVVVWNGILAVRPELEKLRFEAKFLNTPGSRGKLVGEIEAVLGPFAIEEVDKLIDEFGTLRKFPILKERLSTMVGEDTDDFRKAMDVTQLQILEPLGFGYSDEELLSALEDDVLLQPMKP